MDNKRSQHFNYTHETIPIIFHKQTDDFFKYIEKDGIGFLRFWWKHLTENMGLRILSSSEGLGYQVKDAINKKQEKFKIILLTLPKPGSPGEVFYMALVRQPETLTKLARFFLMKLPNTRVFALEFEGTNEDGTIQTGLFELTPRARNIRLRDGVEPVMDFFYKDILTEIKAERA